MKYTIDELKNVVIDCRSIAEVIRKLGYKQSGWLQCRLRNEIIDNNIDVSHFTGQGHLKDNIDTNKLQKYLNNELKIRSNPLKKNLIKLGIKCSKCEECGIENYYNNKPITLELHHIDGNNKNNKLENLQILCPNCHSQTSNFRNKSRVYKVNKKEYRQKYTKSPYQEKLQNSNIPQKSFYSKKSICKCGKIIDFRAFTCKQCRPAKYKINWPTKDELEKLVWEKPMIHLAKDLGVTDKAISKMCKKLNIETPSVGYWVSNKFKMKQNM